MSQKLINKIAVITGGSSGIGLATAKLFVAEGAKVAITGRDQENLDKAITAIGKDALAIKGDVANLSDLDYLYNKVHQELGKIDVLIVNAGIYALAPLSDFTEEMFDKISNTNFKGAFFSVQKALPYLNNGASIVLVSSIVAHKGVPEHSAYSASKAAVRSLARGFTAELIERKIRVNVLTPGPVDTNIFDDVTNSKQEAEAARDNMGEFTPIKRVGTPEEMASANLYLASDDSSFMWGSELVVDGGVGQL